MKVNKTAIIVLGLLSWHLAGCHEGNGGDIGETGSAPPIRDIDTDTGIDIATDTVTDSTTDVDINPDKCTDTTTTTDTGTSIDTGIDTSTNASTSTDTTDDTDTDSGTAAVDDTDECDFECSSFGASQCRDGKIWVCREDVERRCLSWFFYRDCKQGECVDKTHCKGECLLAGDQLFIEYKRVKVTGKLTLHGEPVAGLGSGVCVRSIDSVREPNVMNSVYVDKEGNVDIELIPSTYDLYYCGGGWYPLPSNTNYFLKSGIVITEEGGSIVYDLKPVTIQGKITLNGQEFPENAGVRLILYNSLTNDTVKLTDSNESAFKTLVFPGTYELLYREGTVGTPENSEHFMRVVTIDKDMTLDIDIPMVEISGNVTLNGGPIPPEADFDVQLAEVDTYYRFWLVQQAGTYSVRVMPGTYKLGFSNRIKIEGFPENYYAYWDEIVVTKETTRVDIDIPMVKWEATVNYHGTAPFPDTEINSSHMELVAPHSWVNELSFNKEGKMSVWLIPGVYNLVYDGLGNETLPGLNTVIKADIDVSKPQTAEIDFPTTTFALKLLLNGEPIPENGNFIVALTSEVRGRVGLFWEPDEDGYVRTNLVPGVYDIHVYHNSLHRSLPWNTQLLQKDYVLEEGGGSLTFDLEGRVVSGEVSTEVFIGYPRVSLYDPLKDRFGEMTKDYGDFSFMVSPGIYDVFYSYHTDNAEGWPDRSGTVKLTCIEVPPAL